MFDVASRIVARCIDDGIHVPLVLLRGDVHAPADELEETALKDIHLVHLSQRASLRMIGTLLKPVVQKFRKSGEGARMTMLDNLVVSIRLRVLV